MPEEEKEASSGCRGSEEGRGREKRAKLCMHSTPSFLFQSMLEIMIYVRSCYAIEIIDFIGNFEWI